MPLLAAMPMGVFILDQSQSVRSANQAFLEFLGYRDDEVLGRRLADLILPSQAGVMAGLLAASTANRFDLDVHFLPARGGSCLVKVSFSRLPELVGGSGGVLAVLRDPPAREGIGWLETWTDETLAGASDWELGIATGRLRASRNWFDIWGRSPENEAGMDWILPRIHPLDRDSVAAVIQRTRTSCEAFKIHFRIPGAGGGLRWIEITGRLDPEAGGSTGRIRGTILDITEQRDTRQALARYADIVSASTDRIAYVDRGCRILAANAAFLQALDRGGDNVIDQPFMNVCGECELTTLLYRNLGCCLDQARVLVEDIRETSATGDPLDLEVRLFPSRDESGRVTGIVINIRDVTALRDAERRLLQSAAVYGATSEGVLITDASGDIVAVNAAFTQITGYSESEVLGQKPSLLNSQWHSRSFFVGMWRRLLRRGAWQGEVWNRRKDGEVYRQKLTIRRVLDSRGRLLNFVGVFAERGTASNAPHRAEHLIHYDALTKLPNRLLFESRLDHAIELGRRKESALALFLVDLDHFANINSSLGHQIGDDLLRVIALKLRETIRPSDTLARLRADQFALLFEETGQIEEVVAIARRIREMLGAPIWVRGHQLHVNISIGITISSGVDEERNSVIANAESALRQVKRQGRNGFHVLRAEPDQAYQEHRRMLDRLRDGLGTPEFQLLYRAGVDMDSGDCDCVVASIHWEPPELGVVPPERFLPLANESGLILELGNWALETACRQLQDWIESGLAVHCLVVGIHEAQLTRGDLVRNLTNLLEERPLVATRLELEFSECLLAKHREQVAEVFQGLNELGIGITLNEVGIGWTAPAVLQRLPVRTLKIHSSFIEALPNSHHELAVVEALIAMAQSLGLNIRADGVRTKEQKYQLLNIGCLKAQGDLFGEPLSPSHLESWLNPKPQAAPRAPLRN
ncbi:EAL and GGDEF domain-containing protein [Thiocystis violacea]|uniref:sensor domain-containing protein n=1 Tax=Thiocystis violacea TaxID=13725 RepID=UPI001903D3DB|nr:EAL domain-containing protein [Thiocystis violacea]MBK1716809.1 GGDEF domain-containing protein [Thiocystis violacea]